MSGATSDVMKGTQGATLYNFNGRSNSEELSLLKWLILVLLHSSSKSSLLQALLLHSQTYKKKQTLSGKYLPD